VTLYVYKDVRTKPQPVLVGIVDFASDHVAVAVGEQSVEPVLFHALQQEVLVQTRRGTTVTKRPPKSVQEAVEARLQRNVTRPYFVSSRSGQLESTVGHLRVPNQVFDVEGLKDVSAL
jgi:hypothetical protein